MAIELVCPAGTPSALRSAVDAGAHAVYCGFADETNARNFPGLNFSPAEMTKGVRYAHDHGAKVLVAINTFPKAGTFEPWRKALAAAEEAQADAVILADMAVLDHAATHHPGLRLHLSVQAAANTPEAIGFYADTFNVKRVVLPRVLSVEEIAKLNKEIDVETEAFVFGGLCPMTEGRCSLSSYATGRSPNLSGVCSPPEHVEYVEEADGTAVRLAGFTIDRFGKDEAAGYPTLCKGCFVAGGKSTHLFEDPVSLNAAGLVGRLADAGVTALKIEGRQRGKGYVAEVVKTFRAVVDAIEAGGDPVKAEQLLAGLVEGGRQTSGAYRKQWR
ncbi:putative protease [Breoghania corrubedonensis]|uniref:Ubiquinone biosynthesis protein UbiU n=1 Tax=Breoghania corrubedonensis TaxID=665038 RepID=A0A2T5VB80_9HYPH|nr:peptidase U32 family protein [Breoghania corrubedonensis]PTW61005.1 putative protease [Breoghania corrubedonensis]